MMLPTTNSQAKLFDKKFVALTLRDVRRCDKCKHEYDVKYKVSATDNKPHSSRPVLLDCGHNICENCIYQNRHNPVCAVCLIPIAFEHTRWLKKSYDLNYCLLGQLVNSKSFLSSEAHGQSNQVQPGMLAQESFAQKCSECEQAVAVGICMHCKVDFCKRCFTSVHQNSKVLKKHKMSEFEMQTLQLDLPKEKYCKIHKRLCDKFCQDCQNVLCHQCIRVAHNMHRVCTLALENGNHKDKIISFLETMKQTRENLKKAQKETRECENRLEGYASGVILEINDFFLDLHNHLQLEERRIISEFKKSARSSQKAIREAFSKLADCQTTLNNMRGTLQGYIHKPPNEFHINAVLAKATVQLETMPCQIQISQIEKNPFVFKKLKDVRKEISKSYEVIASDPKIRIRLTPMYGDTANCYEISFDRDESPEPMSLAETDAMVSTFLPESLMSQPSTSATFTPRSKRVNRITNILSPSHFFVQDEDIISTVRMHLALIDTNAIFVDSVNVGEMYLVYHLADKAWLRGVVKEELKKTKKTKDNECPKYNVFLLDYGIVQEIPENRFREIDVNLKIIPPAASACSLLGVAPAGGKWPPEARTVMEDVIQNKPVQIVQCFQDTTKNITNVEIFTVNSSHPVSLRDVLIYTGLGVDTSVGTSHQDSRFSASKITQVSKMKHRLSKPMLHSGEIFRVKITSIENPQKFFAIKFSQLEEISHLEAEMDVEYSNKPSDTIYCAQSQMCCALLVDEKWYRGCIEELDDPNSIRVRLVDDGRSVTVSWRQLHILKDRFFNVQELSIACSLAHVEPLQENAYEWTETAIAEFVRMTSNPNVQMTISSSEQFRYQVILNVLKKHLDVNVGAMLVKYKHALSTGEGSVMVENTRLAKSPIGRFHIGEEQTKQLAVESRATPPPTTRTLKRTPVQVVYIKSPGEFYIHLVEHIPGILKFHEELQLAQERKSSENATSGENVDWQVDSHCMVLASISENAAEQWYRGVIAEIDVDETETLYTVFLRDKGITLREIPSSKLDAMDDLFDRVCSAATLCHLACVHPTGGMKSWSKSAIDEFIHGVSTFESLGATIQGTRVNSSIPVVLWGLMTETCDPLAPCTTKFTNINKILVCAGLAHLAEKIDITLQLDKFVQEELEQGQQTLEDWYEKFKKTIEELPECLDDDSFELEEVSQTSTCEIDGSIGGDSAPITQWLPAKPIEKTVFTAFPTYVDDEAVVYMHDADKHSLLAKMRRKINELPDLKQNSAKADEKWSVAQPCLARYHLDNSLYRAAIVRVLPNKKYEVRFVDYGNVEMCDARDLYRRTPYPNTPIQAHRYRIDGIRPRGGQPCFSTTILDLIHGVIVDKLCAIRVPTGEQNKDIKACSIRFDRTDLATYLIENAFASGVGSRKLKETNKRAPIVPVADDPPDEADSVDSADELREFMKQQITDPMTENPEEDVNVTQKDNAAMFNPEEYRQMFEKLQNEKLYRTITDIDSEQSGVTEGAANSDDDDDIVELEFSFRSNHWFDDNADGAPPMPKSEVGSHFDSFDPLDSSSLLSNFSGIEAFKAPQLPLSVKSFYCDVAYARSPTVLHVFPHLSELDYRQVELARRIQLMARKNPQLTSFEEKTPCLAKYSKDKLWYRAIIRSHNAATRQVRVFYVDFLNSEMVGEENVRKCPNDLLVWPLRTFEMKLFGLKANPRMREKDVKQAVKKCLRDRALYARIIRQRGKTTEICLFASKNEKETPVYEDLIVQKYFCKEG